MIGKQGSGERGIERDPALEDRRIEVSVALREAEATVLSNQRQVGLEVLASLANDPAAAWAREQLVLDQSEGRSMPGTVSVRSPLGETVTFMKERQDERESQDA